MTQMTKLKDASKRWGIVIGVDTYANFGEHLSNLRGCVADARKMFETMTDKECCGFAEDHVVKLEDPTYVKIESAFAQVGEKMKRGDELWFYYAGHGYSERRRNGVSGYLLPSDVKLNENGKLSTRSCISHSGLRDDFIARNIPHGNITIVLFLDCCCAASVGLADGSRGVSADVQEMSDGFTESFRDLGFLGNAEGSDWDSEGGDWDFRYISFMATGTTGKAREDASGGIFTNYLIKGLMGGCPPEYSTAVSDYFVRAGALGGFLGNYLSNPPPAQSIPDATYPLSISPKKKASLKQMEQMDKDALAWLLKMEGKHLVGKEIRRFAENVVDRSESGDFKHAALLRELIQLFSVPGDSPIELNVGAELIKAFYEMKKLLERKDSPDAQVPRQKGPSSGPDRLSARDRGLLADVAGRLGCDDLKSVATQQEAVAALNEASRKWVRTACLRNYHPLYTPNERAQWSNQEGKGFDSLVESAVCELVLDDAALDVALAGRKRVIKR